MADLTVEAEPRFDLSKRRFAPYAGGTGTPDIVLSVPEEKLMTDDPHSTPEIREYGKLGVAFYQALPLFDGFFLHASAVCAGGRAYAFSAPCGTGKSTHAALWKDTLGAEILNDDKPALRLIDDVFYACGTPFSGKTAQSINRLVPLGGIAFLRRAEENRIEPMTDSAEVLWELMNATLRFEDAAHQDRLLTLFRSLLARVPIYRLWCNMTPQAAQVAYEGMRGS